MNYVDLRAAIQEYTAAYEDVFASRIDTFIKQAENRIPHMVRLPPTRKQVTGVFTIHEQLLAPPTDYLSCDSLFVLDPLAQEMKALENKEPEFIRICYPLTAVEGLPRFYAKLDDKTLLVGPAPDSAYTTLLAYFAYPQSICDSPTGRTYIGDNFEALLLYQSLVEAYTFLKGEPDLLQLYISRANEAAMLTKTFGDGKARKDSYQEPDARVGVE